MSAASLPKSDGDVVPSSGESRAPASGNGDGRSHADQDGWQLLDSMRRRLDDQVGQTRKTQAQVTQLAESIAALVDHQRKRSRWLNINSFVAYLVFTLLLGGAFYFLYQSRARELVSARDHAVSEHDAAVRKADEATARLVARDSADAKAWEVYQLIAAGKRDDATRKLAELHDAPLTRLEREILAERGRQADTARVDAAVKGALASFKANKFGDAVAPLEAALAIEGNGPRAAQLHYLLGIARARTNEVEQAISHLTTAIELDVSDDDARFQLASALDRAGQWGKARVEYDRFATSHPQSPSAVFAMRRSATLARMPAVAPNAGQPNAGQPGGGQPSGGQSSGGQVVRPVAPAGAQPGGDQTNGRQPGGGQPGAGHPGGGQTGAGQPGAGHPSAGQTTGGQTSGGQPGGGQPNAGHASGQTGPGDSAASPAAAAESTDGSAGAAP